GGRMNRALPPRDRGDRDRAARRPSRRHGTVPGAVGLVGGTANPPRREKPPDRNPAALKGRSCGNSGFERAGAFAVLALGRDDREAQLLPNGPRQESTDAVRQPAGGFLQFLRLGAAWPFQQLQDRSRLAAVAGASGLGHAGALLRALE